MDSDQTTSLDKTDGQTFKVACEACRRDTNHRVLRSVHQHAWHPAHDPDIQVWVDYQIVQCQGCEDISFRRCVSDTESEDSKVDIYPARNTELAALRDDWRLPPGIRTIYSETHAALCGGHRFLAAAGLRAIVDAVCQDKGAKGEKSATPPPPPLSTAIDDLVRKGVLTAQAAEPLHGTRLLGNKALHRMRAPTDPELAAAFEAIQHMLQDVFLMERVTERLPRRKPTSDDDEAAPGSAPAPPRG
jgi:hypothetical protein